MNSFIKTKYKYKYYWLKLNLNCIHEIINVSKHCNKHYYYYIFLNKDAASSQKALAGRVVNNDK